MRFIGNKQSLVDTIYNEMQSRNIAGNTFFDFFAGTASVGKYFKKLGYQVFSSDLLFFSFVLQQAYITNNKQLQFKKILKHIKFKGSQLITTPLQTVVEYLNQIPPEEGFVYKNYTPEGTMDLEIPRMYFSDENGKRIDGIRIALEKWKMENLIDENEYFFLLACLIESVPFFANISGVYAAFQKKWDPRAIKKFELRPIEFITNNQINKSFNTNSVDLIEHVVADIYYLDPPYNQRQYAPNYHLLETIAKYDNPEIKGVTGLRNYDNQKSKFCNAKTAIEELEKIIDKGKFHTLILSYNSEGIMPKNEIIKTMKVYGNVELAEFDYARFKSNNNGLSNIPKKVKEQLYILQK